MTDNDIALALQTALLGEIGPRLRGVALNTKAEKVELFFYFDGAIDEEDRESALCVETEVMASVPATWRVTANIERLDARESMPAARRWAYRRRE